MTPFKLRVVLCRIRPFPTLISKIKWLGSWLPLRLVQTLSHFIFEKSRTRQRTTLNLNDAIFNHFWADLEFNFGVVLCRIRPFPTIISQIKWFESELPLSLGGKYPGQIQFWDNNSNASCIIFDRTNFELTVNSRIRVDYSITRRAHSPTPGVYLGQKKDKAPKLSPSKREKEISPDRTPVKYPYKGRSRTKSMSPDSIAKRYVTKRDPVKSQLGNMTWKQN